MAKLKVALRALGRGELKGEVVVDRIGKLLAREPALLQRVLSELLDAYVNGAIEAQTFVKLKSHASRCAGASETLGSRHARAATAAIRQLIEAARGPLPPVFVLQFLLYDWRQSLAVVHREYGEASEHWRSAKAATEQLLWSVAPKASDQERSKLTGSLKSLVANLKQVMIDARRDLSTQTVFLGQLADWHLLLVNPAEAAESANTSDVGESTDENEAALIRKGDTIRLDLRDPRYRKLLDLLDSDNVDQIDL